MPPPVSLVLKNNTQETCTFDGTSGNFWSTAPQNQTSISPGGEIHFTLNDDLMFHRAYGYLYFHFSPLPTKSWSRRFFVCANIMSDRDFSYIDAGWSTELDPRPTTAPSNNPDISDTSTVFPLGKIGRSTLHPCKARDLPRDVVIEIGPSDLPIDNLNTGGGHDMWMTEVLLNSQTGPVYGPRPISALYIPGSHDAATWTAMVSNAKCQNNSLYEQLKLGIRSFDLRLFPDTEGDTRKFQPFHGILKRTAIPWNEDLNNIGSSMTTILHQLDTFYKETAGSAEFVILDLVLGGWARAPSFIVPSDVTPTQTQVDNFWKLMHYYFNDKAMALPPQGGQLPTLASVHGSPRRIILRMGQKNDRRPSDSAGLQVVTFYNDFVWDPNQGFRSGPGWNGETYEQSRYGDSKQEAILSFNEKFMQDNKTTLIKRDLFCGYQCQVTPSLPDRAPADRNFAPEFNPRLQQALNTDLWLDCANIISGDFFDGPTIERIISMHWKRL